MKNIRLFREHFIISFKNSFLTFIIVILCFVCVFKHSAYVTIRGQLMRVGSLHPSHGSRELNSGH